MDLFGYPEPVYTADVVKVLNNKMKPSEIENLISSVRNTINRNDS